ncbi:hypothetical protein ACFQ3W_12445 [Paenibacillus puldeungensis]|uniref:Uncharacterized protein n=1 Tax=Paenibacillus puldeungensis TaxID=696536 RepID=A0ABW3RX83_9BACL
MFLAEEVSGLTEMIMTKFPGVTVHRFKGPAEPAAGEFIVELKQEIRRSDSRSHTLAERQYTISFFANHAEEAVLSMEALSRYIMNEITEIGSVPSEGGMALRAASFAIASLEQLEGGLMKCVGTVLINSRESVSLKPHEKIGRIEIRTINH